MDARPDLDEALETFGVEAEVTPLDESTPIETTVIWLPPVRRRRSDEVYEFGVELDRRQAEQLVMAVPKADVPDLPIGSLIAAPLAEGLDSTEWRVHLHERDHHDEWRVVVVPA